MKKIFAYNTDEDLDLSDMNGKLKVDPVLSLPLVLN